jgi:hypothetical protein
MGDLAAGIGGARDRIGIGIGQREAEAGDLGAVEKAGEHGREILRREGRRGHEVDLGGVVSVMGRPAASGCGWIRARALRPQAQVRAGLPRAGRGGIARAMSDEDHSVPATGQPAFVLVRPQMGENIGAAARAMWNFGLDRMRVVAPRDGWPNERAVALASGAGRLLDHAGLHDDVPEAIGDCTYVYATTARERGLTKPVVTPERAMLEAREMIAAAARWRFFSGRSARGWKTPTSRAPMPSSRSR